ncbi:MAG: type 1 fimbrial protein [Paraburkholderia sp.]|jgi:major type 1 subunit fimbrin (pilin)|nr:type 1 fimbrial protein [Paraburkholderia sp.]
MKKTAICTVLAAMGLVAGVAHAAGTDPSVNGGVLTIDGELTAQSCTINGDGQGNDFTVTLPTESTSNLAKAGSTTGSTGFNIALTNCTPETGNVHTFWEYGANTLSDGNLKNNGDATKVEVQLEDFNGGSQQIIDVSKADGGQNSQSVAIDSGAANLQYGAQYISPEGGATAGKVTTNVTYSMAYD